MIVPYKLIDSLELERELIKGKKCHQIIFKLLHMIEISFKTYIVRVLLGYSIL